MVRAGDGQIRTFGPGSWLRLGFQDGLACLGSLGIFSGANDALVSRNQVPPPPGLGRGALPQRRVGRARWEKSWDSFEDLRTLGVLFSLNPIFLRLVSLLPGFYLAPFLMLMGLSHMLSELEGHSWALIPTTYIIRKAAALTFHVP